MGLAENLKILRTRRKLNQEELAQKLGVEQSSVSYWENGERAPRKEQMDKLIKYFGLVESLLNSDNLINYLDYKASGFKYVDDTTLNIPGLTKAELLNYELRKKMSNSFYRILSHSKREFIEYPNIVSYLVENDPKVEPSLDAHIYIQLDSPYKEGDIVVFHTTRIDKIFRKKYEIINKKPLTFDPTILVRQYQIIDNVPLLQSLDLQETWPLSAFGRHLHYIGKVVNDIIYNYTDNPDPDKS